ncbi:Histone-lysine N-methyltransferase, H3 lysine-79 specific [Toxocara canis]|uniref:Histone-lysine N-methyltransferase, H3 lysine-79 specific n=1 Tax=Toxocara canis TaxID=6265 RepID=A0A0B2VT66_TOXCA|nr:Histone-lysine N-methyltransferase, H3 lysine-79 specific [Toxocara canis]
MIQKSYSPKVVDWIEEGGMDKTCEEQDAVPSSSEPPDVKEASLKESVVRSTHSNSSNRSKASSTPPVAGDSDNTERIPMKLVSPIGGEAFTFYWPLREADGYSEGQEILELVKEALSSFPEVEFIMRQKCSISTIDKRDYQQMSTLLDTFNKTIATISQLWKGATKPGSEIWSAERADPSLLKHICARAYNRAVDNVHLLNNHYKAFSSQTYGETSFERMQMIIEEIVPKERDVFVDLGSGVGQLVIHMAGGSRVKKAVGIEVATLPCKYAENLSAEFKKWMKWYGKKFRPFELLEGDFLSESFRDLITKEATIIFINNYAFTAMLENRIKRELLSELKDGTRIISTKPYGTPNRSITNRQLNDISAILDVYEMVECENACSWTSNYVPYYHHTINRAKLEKYFLSQRNPVIRQDGSEGSRRSSTSSKASRGSAPGSSNASRESSVSLPPRRSTTPTRAGASRNSRTRSKSPNPRVRSSPVQHSDDDDEHAIGPTTRRKWQEYCSTKSKMEKAHGPGTVTSSENDPADAVTKWPTPDTEYLPPSAKKRKTGAGRGRPRKNPLPPKAIREDTKEAIDLMHQMTRTAAARPTSPVHESSLVVTDLSSPAQPVALPADADNCITNTETLHSSKYPALNLLLEWLRKCYEAQIETMMCPDYMAHITSQIDNLRMQQAAMHARIDSLTKQISQLLASGVSSLYARLDELGIEANTPSLLLESAKDIVARHKKITAECAALENEITALDLSNQQMEMRKRRREESASSERPLYAVNSSLALAENYQALENQNKNLMNRMATSFYFFKNMLKILMWRFLWISEGVRKHLFRWQVIDASAVLLLWKKRKRRGEQRAVFVYIFNVSTVVALLICCRELLSELKDGTRIISTKPYGTPNRSITNRQLNDISAILDVYEMVECENACSWTSNYVPYYHHTINRAKLEKYFLSQRNPVIRQDGSEGSRRSSTSSKASRGSAPGSSNASRESSVSLPPRRSTTPTRAGASRNSRTRSKSPNPRVRSSPVQHSDDDDEHAIGPTTRRKWQEYCSTKSKMEKAHGPGTVTSSENDPADAVTKWPTPDTEYLPPSAKKRKTGAGRGRPRKNPLPPKAIREDTKEAIDLMHQMTRTAAARPTSPVHESSLVVTDLSSPAQPVALPADADNCITNTETLHSSKYPALNLLLEWLRKCYEAQIETMMCPDYMAHITSQIDNLRMQQAAMHARIDSLTKQISQLLASGVSSLYARLDELGIEANTPSLLLESAKDIVARHKKITAECAALENEITALDLSNQQMEMRKRRREESASSERPLYAVNSSLALAENYQALENQNKNLMNRMAALAAKMEVLPNGEGATTVAQGHEMLLSTATDVHPTYSAPVSTSAYSIPRNVAPPAPSTTSNPIKRARSRAARGGPTNKRVLSSSGKLPSDPKEEEEMERKIQDIVAKALEVDSAAKWAEKERRARGEKRKEKTSGVTAVMGTGAVSGGRRADELGAMLVKAPNVTSISECVSGRMLSPTRTFDEGAVLGPSATVMAHAELESARNAMTEVCTAFGIRVYWAHAYDIPVLYDVAAALIRAFIIILAERSLNGISLKEGADSLKASFGHLVDQAVLLNTLKDALIKVGKKSAPELESSKAPAVVKEEGVSGARQVPSPVTISSPAVEMDIESDKSANNVCEQVLPPPPPAPSTPPVGSQPNAHSTLNGPGPASVPMPPPPCVLPTPPPPPPVVLHPAPPPPVADNTAAALAAPPPVTLVTAVSAPPIIIPPFSGPPPLPFVPSKLPPGSTPLHQELCPSSVAAVVAAPPAVPPTAAAPGASTLSFTTPPPPVLPNTAVPPPVLPVTAFAAATVPPVPICPREVAGTTNVPSVPIAPSEPPTSLLGPPPTSAPPLHPPSLLPTASIAVLPSASFQPSVAPRVLPPLVASTEESTATRVPILASRIDFSKPPPVSMPPPVVQPPPTSQSMVQQPPPTFSVPPPVNAVNTVKPSVPPASMKEPLVTSGPLATVRPTFSSVPYPNGDTQRSFNEVNTSTSPMRRTLVKETFFPPAPSHNTETFVRPERQPLVAASPVHSQRPPLIVPEQNPSTPTSQNVIRTLMSALAIPQQNRSSPPPPAAPPVPAGPLASAAVCPPIDVSQPPPGGSIVNSRTSSPVLLDRYGCPLPVPTKRTSVVDRIQPPSVVPGNVLMPSSSESFHLRPTTGVLHEAPAEELAEDDSELVDFSWPPANFEEQEQKKHNGNHRELPSLEQQPKFFSSPVSRPSTSLAGFNESSPQILNQKVVPRRPFPPPPVVVDPVHAAKNALASATNRPPPLLRNAPPGGPVPPFRPPFTNVALRMRGQPTFPLRRPPPPFGPIQPGARAMRPLFRR